MEQHFNHLIPAFWHVLSSCQEDSISNIEILSRDFHRNIICFAKKWGHKQLYKQDQTKQPINWLCQDLSPTAKFNVRAQTKVIQMTSHEFLISDTAPEPHNMIIHWLWWAKITIKWGGTAEHVSNLQSCSPQHSWWLFSISMWIRLHE